MPSDELNIEFNSSCFVLQPHCRPDYIGVSDTWHDEVDLSQCFQDTAVLYYICVMLWVLAALRFFL